MKTRTIQWKTITIEVTSDGQIFYNGKELKQRAISGDKYMYCQAYDKQNKLQHLISVSRAVCIAFHPTEGYQSLQVDHVDCNTKNNRASNLRWMTRKENNSRKHARQMKSQNWKNARHRGEVIRGAKGDEVQYFYDGKQAAAYIGCSHVLVYRVLKADDYAKTAKGWTLQYVPFEDAVNSKAQEDL